MTMINSSDIIVTVKRNIPFLVSLCLCLYFSFHMFSGKYSYSELNSLKPILEMKTAELDSLKKQSSALEKKVTLLRPDTLSTDLLEEQVRYILGYSKSNEVSVISNLGSQ